MNIFDIIGLLGAFFFLGSYASLQWGLIQVNGLMYGLCNLLGAIAILVSISQHINIAVGFIQVVWALLSIVGLIKVFLRTKRLNVSPLPPENSPAISVKGFGQLK